MGTLLETVGDVDTAALELLLQPTWPHMYTAALCGISCMYILTYSFLAVHAVLFSCNSSCCNGSATLNFGALMKAVLVLVFAQFTLQFRRFTQRNRLHIRPFCNISHCHCCFELCRLWFDLSCCLQVLGWETAVELEEWADRCRMDVTVVLNW